MFNARSDDYYLWFTGMDYMCTADNQPPPKLDEKTTGNITLIMKFNLIDGTKLEEKMETLIEQHSKEFGWDVNQLSD